MKNYGITGPICNWIEDFLEGRSQRVVCKGEHSQCSPWYNIGQGYHWEGLFESYIIGKLEISRFQIQLIAISNFQRKCSSEHFSKMADMH